MVFKFLLKICLTYIYIIENLINIMEDGAIRGKSFMDSYKKRFHKKDLEEDFKELDEKEC
jgi:hypothetical protein